MNKKEENKTDNEKPTKKEEMDIMAYINKEKLNLINDAFNRLGMSLKLTQFLRVMMHFAEIKADNEEQEEYEKIKYVERLIDAFKQIDVNGDGDLQWDEFSNYIVETGISKQKSNFVNVIRNYHLSTVARDKTKHDSSISKIYFFNRIKDLIVIENSSKKLLVYNYLNGACKHCFEAHNGSVICAEYMNGQGLVVTSGSDNCLMFWDPNRNYQLMNKIPTKEIQFVIRWHPGLKYLLTGGFDQMINVYKGLQFDEFGKLLSPIDLVSLKKLHFADITDLIIIDEMKLIASSDYSGVITLWNLLTFEDRDKLQDIEVGHHKGVTSLAYVEEKKWLLSCGTEHFVMIWDLVVGKHVGLLQGHSQSLIGVRTLPKTSQIVTGDVSGLFKVWDSRDLSLVQTFSIPNNGNKKAYCFSLTNFAKKKIVIGADRLFFYEYEESQERDLADSKICISVLYNDVFNTFVTAHIDCIKIWDAETGELKQVFRDIIKAEISCVKFDVRKRKLFVADVEGRIILINILNGAQMKYFSRHKDYVSSMAYYPVNKRLVTVSWDGYTKIHDDDSAEEKGLLMFQNHHNSSGKVNSCNSCDYSDDLGILATGYDNGLVTLMNIGTFSSEGTLNDEFKVTMVQFLGDLPALIVCDIEGYVTFYTLILTKPKRQSPDIKFRNESLNENNKKSFFPVKCVAFEGSSNTLIMGDETGYVKIYDLKEYADYLRLMLPVECVEFSDISNEEYSKELTPELAKIREDLLNSPKYEENPKIKTPKKYLNYSTLMKIKHTLNLEPILIDEWEAHKHGVTSVCTHTKPVFYVTAGHDLKVNIYQPSTEEGQKFEKIGSLMTTTDPNWRVKINIEHKRERAWKQAKKKYFSFKDLDYESLFAEEEGEDEEEEDEEDEEEEEDEGKKEDEKEGIERKKSEKSISNKSNK